MRTSALEDQFIVDGIEAVRRKNNTLWMDILRLAISKAPKVAKSIIREINANDQKIGKLLGKLTKT